MNDALANRKKDQASHREYASVSCQTEVPYPSQTILIPKKEPSLWALYLEANRRRPLLTKSLTTGVLTMVGNISAQYIMIRKGKQAHIALRKVRT
jgi:cell division protein FtsI/penicillin-binding protein 2